MVFSACALPCGMDPFDGEDPPGLADRIEPGSPSLENATIVLLGALSALAVVLHLAGVF